MRSNWKNQTIKPQIIIIIILLLTSTINLSLSAQKQSAYKTFRAKSGDNISTILQRNGIYNSAGMSEFIELNKNNIGRNNTLIIGKTYKLPHGSGSVKTSSDSQSNVIVETLFGKANEKVTIIDRKLDGAYFYLDSGHGGPDPGAIGKIGHNMLCEDEYAYDVTLRLARELMKHGAKVHIIIRDPNDGIRDDLYLKNSKDEVCYPNDPIPLNQLARLKQRVEAANTLYKRDPAGAYKRCIIIHIDARNTKKNIDLFFYHHKGSTKGEQLAKNMRNTIEQKYRINQPGRGYSGDVTFRSLYQLTQTAPVAVFIELGNINHTRDQQRLILENNRQALAKWMCDGIILDYLQNK